MQKTTTANSAKEIRHPPLLIPKTCMDFLQQLQPKLFLGLKDDLNNFVVILTIFRSILFPYAISPGQFVHEEQLRDTGWGVGMLTGWRGQVTGKPNAPCANKSGTALLTTHLLATKCAWLGSLPVLASLGHLARVAGAELLCRQTPLWATGCRRAFQTAHTIIAVSLGF